MSDTKNAYDSVGGSVIANEIENTQINKFHTKGGTGFAAEDANAMNDRLHGRKVNQVGTSNELNGADRIVDGVAVQTKYFDSAAKTVDSAFDAEGVYRYKGQQLEVPSDQYDDCLERMRKKIQEGKVPGVSDPKDAENIIKKGSVSYKQARNIAKAGNVDSLIFDAKSQCVVSGYAFAISFSINFAKMIWDGKNVKEAISDSLSMAIQSGAASFVTGIATAQILRTKAAAVGGVFMRDGVKAVAHTEIGKGVVAKLLRTNVVTSVVTTVVVSAPDFYRAAFAGSISWAQFAKNLAINGAGVAGGAGGWVAGAAGGAAVGSAIPIIGTAVGGILGGIIGALAGKSAASAASKLIMDGLIEDDAKEMIGILPNYLTPLAEDYMFSESEAKEFGEKLKNKIDAGFLRDMYQQGSTRKSFVYNYFEPICEEIVKRRKKVYLPDPSLVESQIMQIADQVVLDG